MQAVHFIEIRVTACVHCLNCTQIMSFGAVSWKSFGVHYSEYETSRRYQFQVLFPARRPIYACSSERAIGPGD